MVMSVDEDVTRDLLETLKDGEEGFTKAADRLASSERPDLADRFRQYASQRGQLVSELTGLAAKYGDQVADESGSMGAKLHRGWMAVKDALSGSDPQGVIAAAEQGEDHAVSKYDDALKADLSPELRTVVQRHYSDVKATHDAVRSMRDGLN
jgi:uncharacterized protein (TIGR02284 family)